MVDYPGCLKGIERSVYGGEVYLGIEPFQLLGDIVCGEVPGSIDQCFKDCSSSNGRSNVVRPKTIHGRLTGVVHPYKSNEELRADNRGHVPS